MGADMIILALESSAKPASAAVCSDGALLGQYFQNNGLTHSRTLLAMVESLLKNLDMPAADVDLVAVSSGPGSFTGVRIGVSAAKGLAWGIDKPICGVSTLEAMAYQTPEPDVLLCPVMDARRSQVYNALFKWHDGTLIRLCADRAISLEALSNELKSILNSQPAAHPNQERPSIRNPPVRLIGDGAEITHEHLTTAGVACKMAPQLLRYQTAYGVALAAMNAKHVPATELEPTYLRPSQAERERGARG
jgi:tRNA threonylcarbamoyladenosine biosynthesis protein TsaB